MQRRSPAVPVTGRTWRAAAELTPAFAQRLLTTQMHWHVMTNAAKQKLMNDDGDYNLYFLHQIHRRSCGLYA